MTVSIVKANLKNIDRDVARALELINYKPKKNKILIKPNLVYAADPKKGLITHPRVVEALIKYLLRFTSDIVIGEGSGVGHSAKESFKKAGYEEIANKYGVKLVDFNDAERYEVKWKFGKLLLPELLKTHEYINVPTIKTHTLTTVTLGIKNQKGLLLPADKMRFHRMDLSQAILGLLDVVKPDLTLMNGLYCLEGNSLSILSKSKKLGIILAGKDVVEVDNACIKIMGFENKEIVHVPKKDVNVVGVPIEKVKRNFIPADDKRKILNAEFRLKGCSGCSVNMERALKMIIKKHPFKAVKFFLKSIFGKRLYVTGMNLFDYKKGKELFFIGNCTAGLSKKFNKKYIKGCPPTPEELIREL